MGGAVKEPLGQQPFDLPLVDAVRGRALTSLSLDIFSTVIRNTITYYWNEIRVTFCPNTKHFLYKKKIK